MRSRELLFGVKQELEIFFSDYSLLPVKIFIHNLPQQAVSDEEESSYPFIIVRLAEKSFDEQYAEDSLVLALGVYEASNYEKAGLDLAELQDALFRFFYEKRIIASFFEVKLPFTAKQIEPDKKWHEYHVSSMVVDFSYNIISDYPNNTLDK